MLELNQIYNGDCLEIMKELPDKSIDLLLTDIPYDGVTRRSNGLRNLDKKDADIFNINMDNMLCEFRRITKGSIYIFCAWWQISEIVLDLKNNGLSTRLCIWEKTNPSPMNGDVIYLSGIEPFIYGKFPKAVFNEHCRNTVFKYPSGKSKIHPTQKNLNLFKELITISSNENDLILDPFLGSGTTALAAKQLNRNYIGIELSKEYCTIAYNRIKSLDNQ
jgi:DNA modification methylase